MSAFLGLGDVALPLSSVIPRCFLPCHRSHSLSVSNGLFRRSSVRIFSHLGIVQGPGLVRLVESRWHRRILAVCSNRSSMAACFAAFNPPQLILRCIKVICANAVSKLRSCVICRHCTVSIPHFDLSLNNGHCGIGVLTNDGDPNMVEFTIVPRRPVISSECALHFFGVVVLPIRQKGGNLRRQFCTPALSIHNNQRSGQMLKRLCNVFPTSRPSKCGWDDAVHLNFLSLLKNRGTLMVLFTTNRHSSRP